jgi:PTS system glucose-specific IIA component
MTDRVLAPLGGRVLPLSDVPDPVFAEAMVGPGLAIDPDRAPGEVVSPVDGEVTTLHPHAFVVTPPSGLAVLVHLGIDTVKLNGEGFTLLAAAGDTVACGQPLLRWDPAAVEAGGRSPVCPVIALDAAPDALTDLATGTVSPGTLLFRRS